MKQYTYNSIEFPPEHYFFGKFVLFTGIFEQKTCDLNFECGRIPYNRLAA
jgi:hypothetical protein